MEIQQPIADERFKMMDNNADFEVNVQSEDYMVRHPHLRKELSKNKEHSAPVRELKLAHPKTRKITKNQHPSKRKMKN